MQLRGAGWVILGVLLLQLYFAHSLEVCAGLGLRCDMNLGGGPTGKRASTTERERKQEEEKEPGKKQKRLDDEAETMKHFFDPRPSRSAHPFATVVTPTTPAPREEESEAVIPPLPAKEFREENVLYLDASGKMVQWRASTKCVVCTCDSTSQCGGNRRLDRCKTKRDSGSERVDGECGSKAGSLIRECVVTRGVEPGGGAAATTPTTGTLLPRELLAVAALKVIPASRSPKHCEVVVLNTGRWDKNLEELQGYTSKGYQSAGAQAEPFPLRPGAMWYRKIGGAHARVLGMDQVTILFEISISATNPARPLFRARQFEGGPFSPSVSSGSLGGLELAWLSQQHDDNDAKLSLSNMQGGRFTGLDIAELTSYFRFKTPGFRGFRKGVQVRGRGKEEVGERQTRRLVHGLFDDFKAALGKVCPADLAGAFEILQNSQAFQAEFQPGVDYRFSQNDKVTEALVRLYTSCTEKKDWQQARYILSLYSPWHTRETTMLVFGSTEGACQRANVFHRLRTLPEPVPRLRFSVFRKDTVKHMEEFCLRPDNVMRAAFSDRACERFLRYCNRNRMYKKYLLECERLGIKPMGKTAFYQFYSEKIFKDMQRQTCCCSVCVNKGGVAFDTFRALVTAVFGATELRSKYLDSLTNLEHFMERDYRRMLKRNSDDSNVCMTFALSKAEDENFRCRCDHEHTPKCDILRQDIALFLSLKEDITIHSKAEDLPDNMWIYQRAFDLYSE
jgi:hypothetical protein